MVARGGSFNFFSHEVGNIFDEHKNRVEMPRISQISHEVGNIFDEHKNKNQFLATKWVRGHIKRRFPFFFLLFRACESVS